MNLKKASAEDKVNVCRKYFIAGIPLLPWVWLVNVAWFWREAVKPDHNPQVRRYVLLSALGALVYLTAIIAWVTVYQTKRIEWGADGDRISLHVPYGEP